MWYREVIGKGRCPIVDTWWQTETGAIMISPIPGATPTKPGSATKPFPGIEADVMTREGKSVGADEGGYLVIKRPWPSMLRTIWGDDERYREQYWSQLDGIYFAGDGARRDSDGYFWIMGRIAMTSQCERPSAWHSEGEALSYRTNRLPRRPLWGA